MVFSNEYFPSKWCLTIVCVKQSNNVDLKVFTVVSKGSILGLLPFNKNKYFFNQSSKLQCKKGQKSNPFWEQKQKKNLPQINSLFHNAKKF